MKYLLLTVSLLSAACIATIAQTNSKQFGLDVGSLIYPDQNTIGRAGARGYHASLSYGWYLNDNTVVGVRPSFVLIDNGFSPNQEITSANLGVYTRAYFPVNNLLALFELEGGGGRVWYNSNELNFQITLREFNGNALYFKFGPGVTWPISESLSFEVLIHYHWIRNFNEVTNSTIASAISPSIGVFKTLFK